MSPMETSLIGALMAPLKENILTQLRWKRYSLNGTVEISSSVNEPIQWHGIGMSSVSYNLEIQFRLTCGN